MINWLKGVTIMDHLAEYNEYETTSESTLGFILLPEDNGKTLTCEARNPKMPEFVLRDSWTLEVQYSPQVSLVFGASDQPIQEGSDVFFECNVQSNPEVEYVEWRFNSQRLSPNPDRGIVIRNTSLLLRNIDKKRTGLYQCLAYNAQGHGASETVVLTIQYSPVCKEHMRRIYAVSTGEEANITCEVDADPPRVIFRWSSDKYPELTSYTTDGRTTSILSYTPRTWSDFGILHCYAENIVGPVVKPCDFHLLLAGPPDSLQNCTLVNQTFSSLDLYCSPRISDGTKQTFHLEIYGTKGERLLANMSSRVPHFSVKGLPTGGTFVLVAYATNSKGRSDTVTLTASTLFSAKIKTEENNENVIGAVLMVSLAALGTLSLLAIVAVVTVIKTKTRPVPNEGLSVAQELNEKNPKSSKQNFEDDAPYVFHTREVSPDYVQLTPKAATECIYESLMDGNSYEKVICKTHSLTEEGLEVIIPVIER